LGLNERQKKTITYLKEHEKIDRRTYCSICGVEKTVAHEELADMVNKELIEMVGKGSGTHYILRMKRTINGRLKKYVPVISWRLSKRACTCNNANNTLNKYKIQVLCKSHEYWTALRRGFKRRKSLGLWMGVEGGENMEEKYGFEDYMVW
jgi:hypothetical protein